jgi:hypothetical protein
LATFKTASCQRLREHHDWVACPNFHEHPAKGILDRRRDPYSEPYLVEDALNGVETAYHPSIFRTAMCRNPGKCRYGAELCAFAHSPEEVRAPADYEVRYAQQLTVRYPMRGANQFRQTELRSGSSHRAYLVRACAPDRSLLYCAYHRNASRGRNCPSSRRLRPLERPDLLTGTLRLRANVVLRMSIAANAIPQQPQRTRRTSAAPTRVAVCRHLASHATRH